MLSDLRNYWSKVKVGGVISGDDYYWTSSDTQGRLPVNEAVDKFLSDYGHSVKFVKLVGKQFVLKRVCP